MGFYGNITNTSRTTFQFDKIYPSRYEMDGMCSSDGVYNGRYVLVEYDTDLNETNYHSDWFVIIRPNEEIKVYASAKTRAEGSTSIYDGIENSELFAHDWKTNNANFFYYFNVEGARRPLTKAELEDANKLMMYFDKGHVIETLNEEPIFMILNKNGSATETNFITFTQAMNWEGAASTIIIDDEEIDARENWTEQSIRTGTLQWPEIEYNNRGVYFGYVANDVCSVENLDRIWQDVGENVQSILVLVKPEHKYNYNIEGQFFQVEEGKYTEDGVDYPVISQLTSNEDNFTKNFNKDKKAYKTSRGYDSTVWQKVIVNGIEKYVMIAELNTVVPTFGISSDPPSLVPINPHWGSDSTNVYYDLHWQPQWGLRVKAADNKLTAPAIDPSGQIYTQTINGTEIQGQYGKVYLRDPHLDYTYYPSDEQVAWSSFFEDNSKVHLDKKEMYYDTTSKTWVEDDSKKVPAAIYYNKDAISKPATISYSGDLLDSTKAKFNLYRRDLDESGWIDEDKISITPTGLSGNIYNRHDGIYGKTPQVDTQELSIMLPGIGNMASHFWDLIYGGRNTNSVIASTNKRNMNIEWENGPEHLYREGLRLRGANGEQTDYEILTLAGCINTAHDLFGMIIVKTDDDTIQNHADTLSFDRIYYNTDDKQYYRKYLDFEYVPLTDNEYVYEEANEREVLTNEKIHNGCYYIKQGNNYVNVNDLENHVYNPNITYYYKTVRHLYIKVNLNAPLHSFPYDGYEWYMDKDNDQVSAQKANYIRNPVWKENKQYYKVTPTPVQLGSDYEANTYYYKQGGTVQGNKVIGGNFRLETAEAPVKENNNEPRIYYKIRNEKILDNINDRGFNSIYVPGKYFYKHGGGDDPEVDTAEYIRANSLDGHEFIIDSDHISDPWNARYTRDGFCYQLLEPTAMKNPDGTSSLYIAIITYSELTGNNAVTRETYIPDTYFYKTPAQGENDPWIQDDLKHFTDGYRYATQNITYKKITAEDTHYQINVDGAIDFGNMSVYRRGTYYRKEIDPNNPNIVTSLVEVTLEELQNKNVADTVEDRYYIFGEYPSQEDEEYTELQEIWNTLENKSDTCNWISLDDFIKIENFKYSKDATYERAIEQIDCFYYADTYHYKTSDGSYILDKKAAQTVGYEYYLMDPYDPTLRTGSIIGPQRNVNFIESDDYYYKDIETGEYILVNDPSDIPEGAEVFTKSAIYVDQDTTPNAEEHLEHGMEWNVEALSVPEHITLAKRTKVYRMKRLPNYAIDTSTINGLILQTEHILESGDRLTRDDTTVAGGLNKVRDIIARFNKMRSNELTIIDAAGRVHSAPVATNQRDTLITKTGENEWHDFVNKDFYPEAEYVKTADVPQTLPNGETGTIMNKQWITVNVDGDLVNPRVTVHHNYQPVKNRPTTYNINDNTTVLSAATATSQNVTYSTDNLEFYIPIVDETGHVVGNKNKTVTLPYSFKAISTNGTSNGTIINDQYDPDDMLAVEPQLPINNNATIFAENAQDLFNLNSYNKWIRINTQQNDHRILIGHFTSAAFKTLTPFDEVPMYADESEQDVNHRFENYTDYANTMESFDYNVDGVDTNRPLDIWYYTFDKAGHLLTQTVTETVLPYSWKKIQAINTLDGVTDLDDASSSISTVVPTETTDTLKFSSVNKWIKLKATTENNLHYIKMGHLVQTITTTPSSLDFNTNAAIDQSITVTTANSFTVDTVTNDEAGHILTHSPKTFLLPYNWKTINIAVQSSATAGTTGTSSAQSVVAANAIDAFTLTSGNKYITLSADIANKNITIGHAASTDGVAAKAGNHTAAELNNTLTASVHQNSTLTPRVNDTFKVPYITIDEVGHVSYLGEDTIQLPGFTVNNEVFDGNISGIEKNPAVWIQFGTDDSDSTKDALKLYRTSTGSLPIHQIALKESNGVVNYYTELDHNNDPITLINNESTNAEIIANRLEQLNKTNFYNDQEITLAQLHTTHFQRTTWLTESIEAMGAAYATSGHLEVFDTISQQDGLISATKRTIVLEENDIPSSIRTNISNLNNQVEQLDSRVTNAELGETEYEYDATHNVNIRQLVKRVALLEDIIKRLVTVDETTNSLVVMSQEELEDELEWKVVTVQFSHADTETTQQKTYIEGQVVKRTDFTAYTGESEVYYETAGADPVTFPFIAEENVSIIEFEEGGIGPGEEEVIENEWLPSLARTYTFHMANSTTEQHDYQYGQSFSTWGGFPSSLNGNTNYTSGYYYNSNHTSLASPSDIVDDSHGNDIYETWNERQEMFTFHFADGSIGTKVYTLGETFASQGGFLSSVTGLNYYYDSNRTVQVYDTDTVTANHGYHIYEEIKIVNVEVYNVDPNNLQTSPTTMTDHFQSVAGAHFGREDFNPYNSSTSFSVKFVNISNNTEYNETPIESWPYGIPANATSVIRIYEHYLGA